VVCFSRHSRVRGNDEGLLAGMTEGFAGIQRGGGILPHPAHPSSKACFALLWIPACAGMTCGLRE